MEFAQVCTEMLTAMYNIRRDRFYKRSGQDDPKASEKFELSEQVLEVQNRFAVPMNKLRLVAPTNVLDAAEYQRRFSRWR
jgi:hypothetical protein